MAKKSSSGHSVYFDYSRYRLSLVLSEVFTVKSMFVAVVTGFFVTWFSVDVLQQVAAVFTALSSIVLFIKSLMKGSKNGEEK